MKMYRIAARPYVAGPGTELQLSAAQAAVRAHNLEPFKARAGIVLVRTKAVVEFKKGETIGLAEMPKGHAGNLVPVETAEA